MSKVYHLEPFNPFPKLSEVKENWENGNYQLVSHVNIPINDLQRELELVFELTNHIDSNWTQNKEVKALRDKVRSTSVGDLVQVNDGRYFYCDMVGWKEVENL